MQVGMVGLGRTGSAIAARLLATGHQVVVHDLSRDAMGVMADRGAHATSSLPELVAALHPPRVVWISLPVAVASETLRRLAVILDGEDVVVDAGSARHADTLRRHQDLAALDMGLVDAGVSGGVFGPDGGFCIAVGGEAPHVQRVAGVLDAVAPQGGWAHVGPPGAGHYTKMVLGGVEHALTQVYAEGFDLLASGPFDLEARRVAEVWRRSGGLRSAVLDRAADALADDPKLERSTGYGEDGGESRWTVETAAEHGVPTPAIASSLFARFSSRADDRFGVRMLAALRNQHGDHRVRRHEEDLA